MRNRKPLHNTEQKVTPAQGATQNPKKRSPGSWASQPLRDHKGMEVGVGRQDSQDLSFTRLGGL